MDVARNRAIVERYFAAWDANDTDVLAEFIAPDVVDHMAYAGQGEGLPGYRAFFALYHGAFPGFRTTVDEVIAEGESVAVRWRLSGTHLGWYHDIAPTGREVTFPAISVMHLRDGFITDEWVVQDEHGLRRQLRGE